MYDTYRVKQNKSFVEDLERGSELLIILLEFPYDFVSFPLRKFDQKTFVSFHIEGCYVQMRLVCRDLD